VGGTGKLTVKAFSKGTSKVTLKAPGAKKLVLTIKVVPKGDTVKVAETAITTKVNSLKVGQYKILKLEVTPTDATNVTATWKSTKPKVASVDAAGKVRALAKGKTVIVAKAGGKTTRKTIAVK
jgi:alpha-amylase